MCLSLVRCDKSVDPRRIAWHSNFECFHPLHSLSESGASQCVREGSIRWKYRSKRRFGLIPEENSFVMVNEMEDVMESARNCLCNGSISSDNATRLYWVE
ncbi:hypothetical protein CEXT_502821 [Caerostris extrusa]|uniref:Uncharacterized protein n=1 Tax=Caerostris extrusa TaxID=172846 RepID=A0AAV4MF94_CAEEX|nr:hypothetical protein CEXT_502821 [Caerostris extrusa]